MKRCLVLLGARIASDSRAIRIVRAIAQRTEVDLFSLDARSGDAGLLGERVTVHSFPGYDYRAAGVLGRLRQHRRFLPFATKARVLGRSFDLVLASGFPTLPPAAEVARRSRARLVYDARWIYLEETDRAGGSAGFLRRTVLPKINRSARRTGRRVERELLADADLVLTSHARLRDWLVATYGVAPPVVVRTVPEPLDPRPGGSGGERVVLYSGALVPGRSLHALARAATGFDPGIRLALTGHGPLESRLRMIAAAGDRTAFGETATADLAIQLLERPSLSSELLAAARVLDGMAAGLPVLATDLPETRALLAETEAGWLIAQHDPGTLAATVNGIFADPDELRRRGENAHRVQRESHNWESEETILLEAIDRLL